MTTITCSTLEIAKNVMPLLKADLAYQQVVTANGAQSFEGALMLRNQFIE